MVRGKVPQEGNLTKEAFRVVRRVAIRYIPASTVQYR